MDEWNTNQHTNSGLVESLKVTKITIEEAKKQTLEFLSLHAEKAVLLCVVIQFLMIGVFKKVYA